MQRYANICLHALSWLNRLVHYCSLSFGPFFFFCSIKAAWLCLHLVNGLWSASSSSGGSGSSSSSTQSWVGPGQRSRPAVYFQPSAVTTSRLLFPASKQIYGPLATGWLEQCLWKMSFGIQTVFFLPLCRTSLIHPALRVGGEPRAAARGRAAAPL